MYSSYILNDNNHKQIMGRLYDYFSKKHNYQVGQGEEDLCYQMMKYQVKQNPAKNGVKPRDYVLEVNIKCIKELIKIISDSGIATSKVTVTSPQNQSGHLIFYSV